MSLLLSVHFVLLLLLGSNGESSEDLQKNKEFLISETEKKNLMELDKTLIDNLEKYSDKLMEKITQLQSLAREIRQPLEAAKGVEEEYLSNPLHSFPLIRHMQQDWSYIEDFMKKPVGQEEINFLKQKLPELPTPEDTKDATLSMYRIAETYSNTLWEMTEGLIDGIQFKDTLTPLDAFKMGKKYFKRGYMQEAVVWFIKSEIPEEYAGVHEVLGLNMTHVTLMLVRSFVEIGMVDEARAVLMFQPDLENYTSSFIDLYQAQSNQPRDSDIYLPDEYKILCRSSYVPKPSRLHCRYNTTSSPFLILAPLKMEEISLDPYVIVYHDILSVDKTEELIRWGDPKMEPTYVLSKKLGQVKDIGRTALGTWYSESNVGPSGLPLLRYISQMLRDISGLRVEDLFSLQLVKYGFGAHYGPHFDFFDSPNPTVQTSGDRIATALFYLNDAPHGGATTFPDANLKVNAERGKVLFWHNLKGETYDVDRATNHGACPVFQGFKYVMTAWIHERDQMFILPTYREGTREHFF